MYKQGDEKDNMTHRAKQKLLTAWSEVKTVQNRFGKGSDLTEALAACQEQAIFVGECLEKQAAEAADIVRELEEYCELLYQVSLAIQNQDAGRRFSCVQKIRKIYDSIDSSLQQLNARVEIVFFPYKASMWDALESVWRAAIADEACDVYVVPIPYCDKNPDGSAKEWHYEGRDFPEEVVITTFDQYSIEEHLPDIAYIHNPYDSFNRVTSVAPEYYSGELKKYADKLVYIPYYYGGEVLSDNQSYLLTQNHADYIVVPGQLAVERAKKYLPKERLLPLGSPKIDRMLLVDGQKKIPEEWSRLAAGRKIILYNTGLTTTLQMGYRTFEKLRMVFNIFKERQDVLLWWRPHPLIKATLASSLPALAGAYEELEKEYLLERIGIYDLSPDGNLAVASTDAFIGDYSSMVYMYGVTGKPIFYLNNNILTENKQSCSDMRMRDFTVDAEGNLLFLASTHGALCRMILSTGEIRVLGQYGTYIRSGDEYKITIDGDKVVLSPCGCGDSIKLVDLTTGECMEYKILNPDYSYNYGKPFTIDDQYIICPGTKREFLIYRKKTKEFVIYNSFVADFLNANPEFDDIYFAGDPVEIEKKIYLLVSGTNQLMEFDSSSMTHRFYRMGTESRCYSNMCYGAGRFWLVAKDGACIASWNAKTGDLVEYCDYPENFLPYLSAYVSSGSTVFAKPVVIKNNVYIFPGTANMILRLDIASGQMQEYCLNLPYLEGQRSSSVFAEASDYICVEKYDERYIVAVTAYDGSVLRIDTEADIVKSYPCRLPEVDVQKLNMDFTRSAHLASGYPPYVFTEDGMGNTLSSFLDYLVGNNDWSQRKQKESFGEYTSNIDGSCGRKVHQHMMREIGEIGYDHI